MPPSTGFAGTPEGASSKEERILLLSLSQLLTVFHHLVGMQNHLLRLPGVAEDMPVKQSLSTCEEMRNKGPQKSRKSEDMLHLDSCRFLHTKFKNVLLTMG